MILQLPLVTTRQQRLWRWWWYHRALVYILQRLVNVATYPRVSYLIRRLSTALLGVGHHHLATSYVFKLAYGQRVAQNYVSLQDPPLPTSPSISLLFFRLFNVDQVLSARSRFYCARIRDPKEEKMGEGLPHNELLLRVLEKSKPLRAL